MVNFPRAPLPLRGERRRPAVTATRLLFALTGLAALVLGYAGLDQYLAGASDPHTRDPLNLTYNTLQLFVLGADPLQDAVRIPLALQIARFAAPAVTLYAFFEAGRVLLAAELRRWRARRSRGHVVVCGDTSVARTLAERLHRAGRRVIWVRTRPIGPLELRRRTLLGVQGDARDPDVLRGAAAGHAAVVYLCTGESAANLAIAAAVSRLAPPGRSDLAIYAQIHEPDWALTLQARRLGVPDVAAQRLDFFHLDELAVRVLLARSPLLVRPDGSVPRVLVAGDSSLARSLLVELARHWRLHRRVPGSRVEVDFVAPDAARAVEQLARRHPGLRDGCRITTYEEMLFEVISRESRYDRAFLCFTDERYGLQVALSEFRLWHAVDGDVVVAVDGLAELADVFSPRRSPPLLDPLGGRLRLFSPVAAGGDPELIAEDLSERLARLIHERYVVAGQSRGDRRAAVTWSDLPESLRRSNRLQAADIGPKLHRAHCAIVPSDGSSDVFRFRDDEIEELARHESRRWVEATEAEAREHGRPIDEETARYLRDWDDLPVDGQEKCRAAIRDIPDILGEAGFQVVRLADTEAGRALYPA
ncbi:NAD-binding protein [Actinoplanes sp. HUAS TT8]|uniref:NAD-binding protein n=1 Tax=Actinoplanes sp. HUAS TT8 TaxID=3447453 RepID=UPI003F523E2D